MCAFVCRVHICVYAVCEFVRVGGGDVVDVSGDEECVHFVECVYV